MDSRGLDISQLRKYIINFKFNELFVEGLGWERPEQSLGKIRINGQLIPYEHVAKIGGASVLKFKQGIADQFNSKSERKKFHKEIKKQQSYKHIVLFSDAENSFFLSYLSKEGQVRDHHSYFKGQNGDDFISKLANIHFEMDDEPKLWEKRQSWKILS